MAESNQRKIADPIDLTDEDPFAELTRIMGFDPRVAVRGQTKESPANESAAPAAKAAPAIAAPARALEPAPAAATPHHDDFSIDLEKELLGDFADFDEPHQAAPVAAEVPAAPEAPAETAAAAIEDEFEDALAEALDEQAPAAIEPQVAEAVEQPLAAAADERAAEFGDDDLVPDFDLDEFELHEPSPEAAPVEEPAIRSRIFAGQQPGRIEVDEGHADGSLAEVDMDFSAAFERDFAAHAEDEDGGPERFADRAPVEAETVEIEERLPEPVAARSADPIEISLEDELNALLEADEDEPQAVQPASVEAGPASEPARGQFLSDTRWAALEADEEDEPVQSASRSRDAAPPAGDARRPFSDPSLIARKANFQAAAAPAAQPTEDLDDLLNAMENEVHTVDHTPAPAPAERAETGHRYDDSAAHAAAVPSFANYDDEEAPADASFSAAPEIETIDVPEAAVAIADDLDIPDLAYEEDQKQLAAYDDIDTDFSAAFPDNSASEEPVSQAVRARPAAGADFDANFEALYRPAYASAGQPAAAQSSHDSADTDFQAAAAGYRYDAQSADYDDLDADEQPAATERDRFVDLDFDSDVEEEALPLPSYPIPDERAQAPQRRGLLIAAVVGGVALLGGIGALALSFGGGEGTDTPVVVKADDSPIKVKPENPGGTTVPNQDNKVYDAVKGTAATADKPAQEKLVTTSEEPVDMAAVEENGALPGLSTVEDIIPKAEDRVDPVADADQDVTATESIAVAPRKVKTMIVRADGKLVPRDDPAPAEQAAAPAGGDETATVPAEDGPTFQSPGGEAVPVKPVKTRNLALDGESGTAPEPSALPPANSPDEPVTTATTKPEAKAEEVAAAAVEPTAAVAAGAWSVQIASQPSAESAKATYEDLARRYGDVIGGRGVNIVKAEIAGKGTYWRVRVPAKSRNDAIGLCTSYKAAGGNCFVSK